MLKHTTRLRKSMVVSKADLCEGDIRNADVVLLSRNQPPASCNSTAHHAVDYNAYDFVRTLAEGSYGDVHECVHLASGERVAVKRFKTAHVDPQVWRLAMREVRVLRTLPTHANIVQLRRAVCSQSSGRLFMVFDLMERSLLQEMPRHPGGVLPGAQLRSVAWQLLQALAHCHKHRVVHRDVKPANVLITHNPEPPSPSSPNAAAAAPTGSPSSRPEWGPAAGAAGKATPEKAADTTIHVKLCDFGFARWLPAGTGAGAAAMAAGFAPRFHTGQSRGVLSGHSDREVAAGCPPEEDDCGAMSQYVVTRWYRPPEIIVEDAYGPHVDIWSYGCTLAELATGEPLFPGSSSLDQLWRITRCLGPLPEAMVAQLRPDSQRRRVAAGLERGRTLEQRIRTSDPQLLDLIAACLTLDSRRRPTAAQLLDMPYFQVARKHRVAAAPTNSTLTGLTSASTSRRSLSEEATQAPAGGAAAAAGPGDQQHMFATEAPVPVTEAPASASAAAPTEPKLLSKPFAVSALSSSSSTILLCSTTVQPTCSIDCSAGAGGSGGGGGGGTGGTAAGGGRGLNLPVFPGFHVPAPAALGGASARATARATAAGLASQPRGSLDAASATSAVAASLQELQRDRLPSGTDTASAASRLVATMALGGGRLLMRRHSGTYTRPSSTQAAGVAVGHRNATSTGMVSAENGALPERPGTGTLAASRFSGNGPMPFQAQLHRSTSTPRTLRSMEGSGHGAMAGMPNRPRQHRLQQLVSYSSFSHEHEGYSMEEEMAEEQEGDPEHEQRRQQVVPEGMQDRLDRGQKPLIRREVSWLKPARSTVSGTAGGLARRSVVTEDSASPAPEVEVSAAAFTSRQSSTSGMAAIGGRTHLTASAAMRCAIDAFYEQDGADKEIGAAARQKAQQGLLMSDQNASCSLGRNSTPITATPAALRDQAVRRSSILYSRSNVLPAGTDPRIARDVALASAVPVAAIVVSPNAISRISAADSVCSTASRTGPHCFAGALAPVPGPSRRLGPGGGGGVSGANANGMLHTCGVYDVRSAAAQLGRGPGATSAAAATPATLLSPSSVGALSTICSPAGVPSASSLHPYEIPAANSFGRQALAVAAAVTAAIGPGPGHGSQGRSRQDISPGAMAGSWKRRTRVASVCSTIDPRFHARLYGCVSGRGHLMSTDTDPGLMSAATSSFLIGPGQGAPAVTSIDKTVSYEVGFASSGAGGSGIGAPSYATDDAGDSTLEGILESLSIRRQEPYSSASKAPAAGNPGAPTRLMADSRRASLTAALTGQDGRQGARQVGGMVAGDTGGGTPGCLVTPEKQPTAGLTTSRPLTAAVVAGGDRPAARGPVTAGIVTSASRTADDKLSYLRTCGGPPGAGRRSMDNGRAAGETGVVGGVRMAAFGDASGGGGNNGNGNVCAASNPERLAFLVFGNGADLKCTIQKKEIGGQQPGQPDALSVIGVKSSKTVGNKIARAFRALKERVKSGVKASTS